MKRKMSLLLLFLVFSILSLSFPASARVKLNLKNVKMSVGTIVQLQIIGAKEKIKWSSNNKAVATVNQNGLVEAKRPGKTTIKAKIGNKIQKCKVTVIKNDYIYHTEYGNVRYENYSPVFDLRIKIEGDKLIVEGELKKSVNNSNHVHVLGKKHVFILTDQTEYWNGDMRCIQEKILSVAPQYIGYKGPWFILDMKDGKVSTVGIVG